MRANKQVFFRGADTSFAFEGFSNFLAWTQILHKKLDTTHKCLWILLRVKLGKRDVKMSLFSLFLKFFRTMLTIHILRAVI